MNLVEKLRGGMVTVGTQEDAADRIEQLETELGNLIEVHQLTRSQRDASNRKIEELTDRVVELGEALKVAREWIMSIDESDDNRDFLMADEIIAMEDALKCINEVIGE